MKKTKIVIAGGGFAGLYAAKYFDKHLARRPDIEVTLIARENFILFTPMLHEVAAGDLAPGDIVNPLRRILRHVNVIEADVQDVDLSARKVRVVHGFEDAELEFEFDHLLLALGSETNFFDNAGIRDWAVTMKNLSDAALLRNRIVAFLEEATLEKDAAARRQWLTFVIAGGGFAGAETAGALNDFVRETAKFYPRLGEEEFRVVVIHPGDYLLPELGEELGRYAERKLRERKVEVIKGARVASYDGWVVTLNNGISIPAATLIWTAGVKPSPVVAALPCPKEKGRICANEYLQVPGFTGLWAAGDCAAVADPGTQGFLSANCTARNARSHRRGEKHRAHDSRATAAAVSISNDGHAREHRPSHWRGEYVRIQVLRFHRLVDVALGLFNEAAANREEIAGDDGMDSRSFVRARHRTDDHVARCRRAQ